MKKRPKKRRQGRDEGKERDFNENIDWMEMQRR